MLHHRLSILAALSAVAANNGPPATSPTEMQDFITCDNADESFTYRLPAGPIDDLHAAVHELNLQGGPLCFSVGEDGIGGYITSPQPSPSRADLFRMFESDGPSSPPIGEALARRLGRGRR